MLDSEINKPEEGTVIAKEHYDRRAEQGLLGCALRDAAEVVPELVKDFPPGMLYISEHEVILDGILDCFGNLQDVGGELTVAILVDYLRRKHLIEKAGGEDYIFNEIAIQPSAVNWKFHKDRLLALHQERQFQGVLSIAGGNGVPVADRVAKLQKSLANLTVNRNTLDLANFGDMEVKCIDFLWPNKLAAGALNLIAGNGGVGKGQVATWLAAKVTRGSEFPDDSGAAPTGDVLFVSDEDNPETTILPRLIANGANVNKVNIVRGFNKDAGTYFNLATDMQLLYDTLDKHPNIKLIIFDPLNEYIKIKNQNDESAVRAVLTPLVRLAETKGICIIGLTHFNKKEADSFMARVMASSAFVHQARTVWGVVVDKDDPDSRCFMPVKWNILKDPMSMKFTLQDMSPNYPEGDQYCKVVFDETPFKGLIDDYGKIKVLKVDTCSAWVEDILADGPMDSKELFKKAEDHGYNRSLCFKAKEKMGDRIKCTKQAGYGAAGGWDWFLNDTPVGGKKGIID